MLSRARSLSPGKAASLCLTVFVALLAASLSYPQEIKEKVLSSTLYCLTVLTPSLFPFMALTSYGVNSGASFALGKLLGGFFRVVFRLPPIAAVTVLMSFLGGYPAGAKGVSVLLQNGSITREQAARMMLFCINPGIAFVVTFVGGTLLSNTGLGWVLFFSVTAAGLLLGFLAARFAPKPSKEPLSPSHSVGGAEALIRCAADATSAMVKMSACIVLFSVFTAILQGSGIFALLTAGLSRLGFLTPLESAVSLSFLIEVTGGVGDAQRFFIPPVFYAFGLAFGGICVHLQVFSFFQHFPLKKWKFFLFRFLHGFLAAALFSLFSLSLPENLQAVSATFSRGNEISALSGTVAGGISLLLLGLAFLLMTAKNHTFSDCSFSENMIH